MRAGLCRWSDPLDLDRGPQAQRHSIRELEIHADPHPSKRAVEGPVRRRPLAIDPAEAHQPDTAPRSRSWDAARRPVVRACCGSAGSHSYWSYSSWMES